MRFVGHFVAFATNSIDSINRSTNVRFLFSYDTKSTYKCKYLRALRG